jgi:hypothetical protein
VIISGIKRTTHDTFDTEPKMGARVEENSAGIHVGCLQQFRDFAYRLIEKISRFDGASLPIWKTLETMVESFDDWRLGRINWRGHPIVVRVNGWRQRLRRHALCRVEKVTVHKTGEGLVAASLLEGYECIRADLGDDIVDDVPPTIPKARRGPSMHPRRERGIRLVVVGVAH